MKTKVKICCISSIEEANTAIEYGASALGLVGEMPSGPGVISDELIAEIAAQTAPPIATFLLTSKIKSNEIIAHAKRTNTNTIQLVDEIIEGSLSEVKFALPSVKLVQVIHIIDYSSIEEALSYQGKVSALLLDSGNPNLIVKELGGTGKVHNWDISREICREAKMPVFLAGGLSPENVREAIDYVQPWGVDICSGVRTNFKLDRNKLDAFFKQLD